MPNNPTPAAKPRTANGAVRNGKVSMRYVEIAVPENEELRIPWVGKAPEVHILGVDRVEGHGMAQWQHVYRLVLVWR